MILPYFYIIGTLVLFNDMAGRRPEEEMDVQMDLLILIVFLSIFLISIALYGIGSAYFITLAAGIMFLTLRQIKLIPGLL